MNLLPAAMAIYCFPSLPMYEIGFAWATSSVFTLHNSWPVLVSKARNMWSMAAPMKISPPAVVIGPPPKFVAPVLIPAATLSIVQKVICQAMWPVFTLPGVSLPHGGGQQAHPSTATAMRGTPGGRPNNLGDSGGVPGSESKREVFTIQPVSVGLMM